MNIGFSFFVAMKPALIVAFQPPVTKKVMIQAYITS